ncbi:hypothetical protein Adeh_1845 [Anaeromyxobacter dehalogenans 2CP-C]|uniref:Uncharacterized protein n=1 Tax=Anaeromyxobacter dehalogenans (strain 2CP-C) TaxID=290397 RepID=Q2IIY6_ANADE|nr:hypothetical protein Adeh_1845 [Anaeromyxobacter dehalogenans 2CP-C]
MQERILRWAAESLGLANPSKATSKSATAAEAEGDAKTALEGFETAADALAASHAETQADQVLVVAAFLTKKNGKTELTAQEINTELKNQGHGIGSINKVIDTLKDQKPQLMIQTKKSGKTQQARKNYKVTGKGFEKVQKMLSASPENGEE